MYVYCVSIILFSVCANVLASPVISCKLTDSKCFEKEGPKFFERIFEKDPKIGTEDLDPMHHDFIDGNLSILKYKLTNSTVKGFKQCTFENFKLNPASLGLGADVVCPSLKMYGDYEMHGKLIVLPVEGTGEYSIIMGTYRTAVDVELKNAQGKDGKTYVAVKSFRLNPEAIEPVKFQFKNLFNGQKDLSDAIHKYANENWKEVIKEVQSPVMNAHFKKIVKNANKILKSIPLEDLIQL